MLLLNAFQIRLHSINKPASAKTRTMGDIEEIQDLGFQAGLYITQALGLPVNTKMYRMMHPVNESLRRFGCARRGDTDANETQHKSTKDCYSATNRKHQRIAEKLLQVRSAAEATETETIHGVAGDDQNASFENLFINSVLLQANMNHSFDASPLSPDTSSVTDFHEIMESSSRSISMDVRNFIEQL